MLARLRDERGMTVVEVMVAAMILVIGSLGLLSLVDAGVRNTYRAEQSQVVSNRLQSELEKIRDLPYGEVALSGLPSHSTDHDNPAWRVSGTQYATTRAGTSLRPMVYNGSALIAGGTVSGGAISPTPVAFDSGDIGGTIYRYVVWENSTGCPESLCPGAQDMKRIVVAIKLDPTASGGDRGYQELQAQMVDPDAEPVDNANPIPPGEDTTHPWTFFLTDTTCNNTTRQPVTGEHLAHNTRGLCSAGTKNGNAPGAPDLLYPEPAPPDPETPLYDFATDVEPVVNPELDKGLQMIRGEQSGCQQAYFDIATVPDSPETNRFHKVHKWVTPAIPSGYEIELDGDGTFAVWTETVGGAAYEGKLCVWLFVRRTDLEGNPVDLAAVNAAAGGGFFTYAQDDWPVSWTEIIVPLDFTVDNLVPGDRLGIAVAIEKDGTGAEGLQLHYDEPSFDSRLEVKTHSTLPDLTP